MPDRIKFHPQGVPSEQGALVSSIEDLVYQINAVFAAYNSALRQYKCVAYNSSAQSIANATFTVLTFDSEDLNVGGMHSTTINTSRLTIPAGGDGVYLFIGSIMYAGNIAGITRVIVLRKNGATSLLQNQYGVASASQMGIQGCWMGSLVAGDYIEMLGYQDSGGALNTGSVVRSIANSLSAVRLY